MRDGAFAPLDPADVPGTVPTAPAGWVPILPVPADAPRTLPPHRLGKPSAMWVYRNAAGDRLGIVCRFDPADGKQVLPLTYCRGPEGRTEWRWQGFPEPRPIYGLDRLADRPGAPVLVTEGEKAADAAGMLFPDHVPVTSPGGTKAAAKADWSPLAGRHVTIWPDHDAPGGAYAAEVEKLAHAAGAASVRTVPVPETFPPKWDLADPIPEGWDADRLRALATAADPWPVLVPLDTPDLPRLDRATLPGWAGDFVAALADATETPPEMAAGMVLATCSAAVARRYRVMVGPGYFEPCNLWIAVALPPGNRKSAVQSAAAAPLLHWERAEADRMKGDIEAATSAARTAEARVKELRTKAAKADTEMEARDYAEQAASIEAEMPTIPRAPRLWTSDATPERLGTLLADHGENMAWLSSEGGVFDLLAGRYSGGVPNLDLVLKAHAGDAERVDRGSRPPVYLRQPLLTIGLSPQPDVLRGLTSRPGFRGRGLLGRFLWMLPPSPLGWRTLTPAPIPERVTDAYGAGVRAILDTPPALGDDGEERPHLLRLSDAARAEWLDFARHIEVQMRPGGDFEGATDWAGKAPGAAARLAGVLHIIATGGAETEISADTMGRALTLMAVIARHSLAALDLMGADEAIAAARRVWAWIEGGRRDRFTVREVFQALKGQFPRVADLTAALDVLAERGYLTVTETPRKPGPGKPPSPTVEVRPDIREGWA